MSQPQPPYPSQYPASQQYANQPPPLPQGVQPLNYIPPQYAGQQYAPCYNCGCTYADKVSFTWWGGLLGPKVLTHVKCRNCKTCYNGKSGQSNTTNIILYTVVILVLSLVVFGALGFAFTALAI